MADSNEPTGGPAARLAWFIEQRMSMLRQKPPSGDITEPPPPGPAEPPSLPDLMRQYRERLRNPGGTP